MQIKSFGFKCNFKMKTTIFFKEKGLWGKRKPGGLMADDVSVNGWEVGVERGAFFDEFVQGSSSRGWRA